ncbi:MAG: hypothetical protein ACE5HJ_02525 [Thermoplasmata archaeon]
MATLDPYVFILLLVAGLSWVLIVLAWALPRRKEVPRQKGGYRIEHVGLIAGLGSFSLIALLMTGLLEVDNPIFPVSVGAVLILILLLALAEYFYWREA